MAVGYAVGGQHRQHLAGQQYLALRGLACQQHARKFCVVAEARIQAVAAPSKCRISGWVHGLYIGVNQALYRRRIQGRKLAYICYPIHRHQPRLFSGGYIKICVVHTQRRQDVFLQQARQALAAGLFQDMGQDIGRDAVAILAAGLECQWLSGQLEHHLVEAATAIAAQVDGIIAWSNVAAGNKLIGKAAAMGQQVFDQNGSYSGLQPAAGVQHPHAGKGRVKLGQGVIQAQLALLDQHQGHHRDNGFGHGVDAVQGICGNAAASLGVYLAGAEDLAFGLHQPFDTGKLFSVDISLGGGLQAGASWHDRRFLCKWHKT